MSIISCPDCNKQISSRAVLCNYCGFELGEVTAQDIEVFRARKLRERIYRLSMISYAVITVFVAGFGWYWSDSQGFVEPSSAGPFFVMGISAVAYLLVRAMLFRSRQLRKSMREKIRMNKELRRNL